MGSANKFADAQTGVTYTVYKPSTTLSMPGKLFQLIECQPGEEPWVYAKYGGTVRYIEIMQTMAGVKCSDPGVAKLLKPVVINGSKAQVYVYCDPAKAASFVPLLGFQGLFADGMTPFSNPLFENTNRPTTPGPLPIPDFSRPPRRPISTTLPGPVRWF